MILPDVITLGKIIKIPAYHYVISTCQRIFLAEGNFCGHYCCEILKQLVLLSQGIELHMVQCFDSVSEANCKVH